MEAWQDRVVAEKQHLDEKISRLTAFIAFKGVDFAVRTDLEKGLMIAQLKIMNAYSDILKQRIDQF